MFNLAVSHVSGVLTAMSESLKTEVISEAKNLFGLWCLVNVIHLSVELSERTPVDGA